MSKLHGRGRDRQVIQSPETDDRLPWTGPHWSSRDQKGWVDHDYQSSLTALMVRYSLGDAPVQRLKAREKLLGSEKPSR